MALLYLGCSGWSCGLSQVRNRLPSSSDCAPPTQVPVPLSREPHPRALGASPGCDCFNFQLCGFRQGAQGHGAPLSSATLTSWGSVALLVCGGGAGCGTCSKRSWASAVAVATGGPGPHVHTSQCP